MKNPSPRSLPLKDILKNHTCPACGHHVAVPFFYGEQQPLATLAWPQNKQQAISMQRHPLDFVRCVKCGHIYNARFEYGRVPYSKKPNLMFNGGELWSRHLSYIRQKILDNVPKQPSVIEIGCGDGHFLRGLAEQCPGGTFIGFDPNSSVDTGNGLIEFHADFFLPQEHLKAYQPDLIISRHVLEHLNDPLGFIQSLSFAADWEEMEINLFIEVPCVDRVFSVARTQDFYYEHNSHFTTGSLTKMMERCASNIKLIDRSYHDEILFAMASFKPSSDRLQFARESLDFYLQTKETKRTVADQLEELLRQNMKVVIWGGTGKAASFMNHHQVDAGRFPVVVDSDRDKEGTFVPGTGQRIHFRDYLHEHPADTIIIPPQWRAKDIVTEIETNHIGFRNILIEHHGKLIDYFQHEHPYK